METILRAFEGFMEPLRFVVPGRPRGKGRHRSRWTGSFVQTYPDVKTVSYENLVKLEYERTGGKLIEGPVGVAILVIYGIPKSASKKMREDMLNGDILPSTKPDADNVAKAVLDGLNGVAYADDTHVTREICDRRYGEVPRVEVTVMKMPGRFKNG